MKKGLILFTAVEAAALLGWFFLVGSNSLVAGVAILLAGLVLEHFLAYRTLVGKNFPIIGLSIISASEAVIWVVWLLITKDHSLPSLLFLALTMFLQHSIERNVFRGNGFFDNLIKLEVAGFTLIEALAAGAWLKFVEQDMGIAGATILAIGLLVEHIVQSKT